MAVKTTTRQHNSRPNTKAVARQYTVVKARAPGKTPTIQMATIPERPQWQWRERRGNATQDRTPYRALQGNTQTNKEQTFKKPARQSGTYRNGSDGRQGNYRAIQCKTKHNTGQDEARGSQIMNRRSKTHRQARCNPGRRWNSIKWMSNRIQDITL